MNAYTAKCFLVQHRQDFNRDRLPWLPARLYRSFREALPNTQEPKRDS